MNRFTITVLGVASALALTAAPVLAQHRGGGHSGGGSRGGGHVSRAYSGRVAAGAPRGSFAVRSGAYRAGGVYRGGGLRVGPTRFYRPYYTFRPRFSLGFGLWAGYPFAYGAPFYDPYAYAYPYPYGPYPYSDSSAYPYPPQVAAPSGPPYDAPPQSGNSVAVQPSQSNMGGLSFDITPAEAQVFVDGRQVGTVGQFTATSQPLGLPAGHHQVEIRAEGYRTMSVDADIIAGQVIPYQGTLER